MYIYMRVCVYTHYAHPHTQCISATTLLVKNTHPDTIMHY